MNLYLRHFSYVIHGKHVIDSCLLDQIFLLHIVRTNSCQLRMIHFIKRNLIYRHWLYAPTRQYWLDQRSRKNAVPGEILQLSTDTNLQFFQFHFVQMDFYEYKIHEIDIISNFTLLFIQF